MKIRDHSLKNAWEHNEQNMDYFSGLPQFFVKKPKIFENVKSEHAAANFQESQTPRVSTIISNNSQI